MKIRKHVSLVLALVFVFVSLFSAMKSTYSKAEEVNLLRGDPTFESYAVGHVPSEVFDFVVDSMPIKVVNEGANGTSKSVQLETTAWQTMMQHASASQQLKQNTDYKLTCWVKGKIFLVAIDIPTASGSKTLRLKEYPGGNGPAEWTKLELPFKTEDGTLINGNIGFILKFQAGGGNILVDEISLVEVVPATPEPTQEPTQAPTSGPTAAPTEGPNLLSDDSTFESYEIDSNGAPFINVLNGGKVVNEGANGTSKSYKMPGGWSTALHQEKTNYVEGGKFYVFGAWVKGTSKPEHCKLTIADGAANDFVVDLKAEMPDSIAEWTYVSKEFTAPAGAGPDASTVDGFMLISLQSGVGDFYIDEITVHEIPELSPTPSPAPTATAVPATPTPQPTDEPEPVAPAKPKLNKIDDDDKTISGRVEEGVTVQVKFNGKSYKATVKGTKFTYKLKKPLAAGTKISAFATRDNLTSKAGTIVVIPHKPSVNKLKAGATVVKGKATKKAKVFVVVGKKTYSGKVSKKGTFSVKVKKLKKKTTVKVRVKAGNKFSDYVTVKVK